MVASVTRPALAHSLHSGSSANSASRNRVSTLPLIRNGASSRRFHACTLCAGHRLVPSHASARQPGWPQGFADLFTIVLPLLLVARTTSELYRRGMYASIRNHMYYYSILLFIYQ